MSVLSPALRRLALSTLLTACTLAGWSREAASVHEPPSNYYGVRIAPMGSSQGYFTTCSDAQGGAIVAFEAQIGSSRDLFVQRVNPLGAPLWAASGVPVCTTLDEQWGISSCSDDAGGIIVFWSDTRGGGVAGHSDIYAQRIDASGVPLWTPQGVPVVVAPNSQQYPRPVPDGEGGAILTWWDYGPSNAVLGVHAQRVDASGALLWGLSGVPLCDPAAGDQHSASIAPDGAGGAIVVWRDTQSGSPAVQGQRISPAGDLLWGANGTRLSFGTGSVVDPSILEDGNGGAFITWAEYSPGPEYDAYVQRVDAAGIRLWTGTGIQLGPVPGSQAAAKVAPDGAGGAFVVWQDLRSLVATDLYIQRFDAAGTALWAENGMELSMAAGIQREPNIIPDGGGGAIVAWWDDRSGTDKWDVYAQGVGAEGTLRWTVNGAPICTARYGQAIPRLVPSTDGSAVVVWSDGRAASYSNIYASQTPQGPVDVHDDHEPEVLSFAPVGPNPTRGGVHLAFELAEPGPVRLSLYDVTGRRLRSLSDEMRDAGVHQVYVDLRAGNGARLAAGLYLVRLEAAGQVRTRRLVLLP